MSALSAIETQVPTAPAVTGAGITDAEHAERPLRAVGSARSGGSYRTREESIAGREPRSSSIPPAHSQRLGGPAAGHRVIRAVPVNGEWTSPPRPRLASPPATGAGAAQSGVRLTGRGRLVVGVLVMLGLTAALLVTMMLASGGAQATNRGPARAGYQGMHQVVVQPGQTLWSIAAAAEPTADPRTVIGEIMSANALQRSDISAGQLLWVP